MADLKFSTGLQVATLARKVSGANGLITDTISFGTDQIVDAGKLGAFNVGDFVRVRMGVNDGVYARVISGDSGQLTFAAGTFAAAVAGTSVFIETVSSGSFAEIMKNGVLYLFGSPRRASADDSEGLANTLAILTLNGGSFVPGESANGFNMELSGARLGKAIDPATGVEEVVSGVGIVTGTPSWGCWYDNARVQGASTSAIRLDGTVSTSTSAVFTISNQSIIAGEPVYLKSINIGSGNA